MRARPNPSGEQLVTEYLTRVAQEARLLPKGARIAFVGRTRALIERELGPRTRTEPEQVLALLDRLGKPEDLVREERTRIDRSWVKSRAASKEKGDAAAAAVSGPRMNRPLTARRRPNSTDTQPFGRQAQDAPDPGTGPVTPAGGTGTPAGSGSAGPRSTGLRGVGPRSAGLRHPVVRSTSPRNGNPRSGGLRSAGSPAAGSPAAGSPAAGSPAAGSPGAGSPGAGAQDAPPQGTDPQRTVPLGAVRPEPGPQGTGPLGTGPAGGRRTGPLGWLAGKGLGTHGLGGNETLANAGQLARDNLRESIAILLLGLGGLILPFPFWPLGAIAAMFSRLWDVKDKSLAVAGPLLVALAASVLTAAFIGGSGNIILVYAHALHVGFSLLIRVGSVLTAAYLAWRVSRGPRVKVPPWQRIKRS